MASAVSRSCEKGTSRSRSQSTIYDRPWKVPHRDPKCRRRLHVRMGCQYAIWQRQHPRFPARSWHGQCLFRILRGASSYSYQRIQSDWFDLCQPKACTLYRASVYPITRQQRRRPLFNWNRLQFWKPYRQPQPLWCRSRPCWESNPRLYRRESVGELSWQSQEKECQS